MADRTPVLVGVGQLTRRDNTPDAATEPVDVMAEVLRTAARDAGGGDLLRRATGLWVVDPICWHYRDPCLLVAERLGIDPPHRLRSGIGGDTPGVLVDRAARAVQRGEHDVVLICGAEAMRTRRTARKQGRRLDWTAQGEDVAEPELLGAARDPIHPGERAVGLALPVAYYPLFENAVRAAAGRTRAEHTARIARLWSRFSEVAADNPYAWRPEPRTAAEVATPGPDNRMIGFPYPKLMNADIGVDMAAAVIICSASAARAAGVPTERWIFPWVGSSAHDHWFVGERPDLGDSPAIRANGRAALGAAGLDIDDIAHLDLYSCFPSAVQVAADALGLDVDTESRPLTVTGGLTFAGGPGSNYVTHALAAMVQRLRADPDGIGLVTGNGWYLTKHAVGVFGSRPPRDGYQHREPQAEVDRQARQQIAEDHHGTAILQTYTVLHAADGSPERAIAACRRPDGRRVWVRSTERGVLDALEDSELLGSEVRVAGIELAAT